MNANEIKVVVIATILFASLMGWLPLGGMLVYATNIVVKSLISLTVGYALLALTHHAVGIYLSKKNENSVVFA